MSHSAQQSDLVLQPFQMKHLTLRNRIMSTAHAPQFADENGHPGERYIRYHEEKAKGGLALTIFGGSSNVSRDSPSLWGQIDVSDDSVIPPLTEMSSRIHAQGAAAMCQITHMGRRTTDNAGDFLPVIGPSHTRERLHRAFPKAMEQNDIERVIQDFAAAAGRCQVAGLDGIELLSFAHLIGQFLSPAVNQRTDNYGGTLEKRLQFLMEVLSAVREAVGPDFIVGVRAAADEQMDGGNNEEECTNILRQLSQSGLVDFLNLNVAFPYNESAHSLWMPDMGQETGSHMNIVSRARKAVDIPVFHAGGINDLATARYALREGILDMVGMTRAHLADPHIVAKIERGDEERIRPCVGAGYCVNRGSSGMDVACIHNVVTGRERYLSHKIDKADVCRKVVVVGGGPGGMEAARVCSERGHKVILMEATDRLGGQLIFASQTKSRRQMHSITEWLQAEIERLGVDIRYNVFAEASDVMAEQPEIVVIATGGLPDTRGLENTGALSVLDVLSGGSKPQGKVLLYDDHGNHQGLSCAEYLLDSGVDLEIVTPDRCIGQELRETNRPPYMRRLYEKGVRITPDVDLISVEKVTEGLKVTLRNEYTCSLSEQTVDALVIDAGVKPFEDVFLDLREESNNKGQVDLDSLVANRQQPGLCTSKAGYSLFRIGDAVSARDVHSAMYEAHRLCRFI